MQVEDICSVAVSKDGRFIAAGSQNGQVLVWDATTYKQVFVGELGSIDPTCDVDFSPDSTRLVTGHFIRTATIWDIAAGQKVRALNHPSVHSARYSPQGDRIATASYALVRVWDSNNGRLLLDTNVSVLARSMLWSNNHLFVTANDSTIKQINAETGSTTFEWPVRVDGRSCIALSQHGKFIAHSTSSTLTFWDITTHTQSGPVQHFDNLRSFACSPDGLLLAIVTGEKIIVRDLYSVRSRFVLVCFVSRFRSVFTTSVFPHIPGPRT